MSKGFIVGNGGSAPFAFVFVTYPEGSTVTCTNSSGKKDISATQRLFYVKKNAVPFDCVVTATFGASTKTETVSITHEGQGISISLAYNLILFDANVENGWEHKNRMSGYGAAAIENGEIHLKGRMPYGGAAGLYTCLFYYTNSVRKANYTTLKIDVNSVITGGVYLIVQTTPRSIDVSGNQDGAPVARMQLTAAGTFSLEYPSGGDYYVGILCAGTSEAYVSKVWLE